MKQIDKAGKSYWNDNWSQVECPKAFDESNQSLDNYVNLQLHKFFKNLLKNKENIKVLEIGCANSIWPVYFHQYFKAEVYGLDYSETGCRKSLAILEHYKITGEIYNEDIFFPSENLKEKFDLVVSFGVVEHFQDTSHCLKACAYFVKPGGFLFTLVPNIPSIIGLIQKLVDKKIYDIHVPLTKKNLIDAHQEASLGIERCDYFMSINLSIVASGSFASNILNPLLRRLLSGVSKVLWWLEKYGLKIPKNPWTSPYIIAVGGSTPKPSKFPTKYSLNSQKIYNI